MGLMFSSFSKLKRNAPLPAFVFTPSLPHPPPRWRRAQGRLGLYTQVTYAVTLSFLLYLFAVRQVLFFAYRIVFCAAFLVDCITLWDFIFDSRSYCSRKLSKPLRSCRKLLFPFMVEWCCWDFCFCGIVTPLSLHFYSLREGNSTFRGYSASYIAPKGWDWVMYG